MRVTSAQSSELFVGPRDAPLQLVRVTVEGCTKRTRLHVDGDGLSGEAFAEAGQEIIEVPVTVDRPVVGQRRTARVHAGGARTRLSSPSNSRLLSPAGPCSWSATSTTTRSGGTPRPAYQRVDRRPPGRRAADNSFELVHAHLEMARREPEYQFVLPKWITSSPTGTSVPRTAPTCAGSSPGGSCRGNGRHV